MGDGRTVLSPVAQADGVWRVQITWANGSKNRIGKFGTKQEAEKWIADHRLLTDDPSKSRHRYQRGSRSGSRGRRTTPESPASLRATEKRCAGRLCNKQSAFCAGVSADIKAKGPPSHLARPLFRRAWAIRRTPPMGAPTKGLPRPQLSGQSLCCRRSDQLFRSKIIENR
jgi:hypothetical protein